MRLQVDHIDLGAPTCLISEDAMHFHVTDQRQVRITVMSDRFPTSSRSSPTPHELLAGTTTFESRPVHGGTGDALLADPCVEQTLGRRHRPAAAGLPFAPSCCEAPAQRYHRGFYRVGLLLSPEVFWDRLKSSAWKLFIEHRDQTVSHGESCRRQPRGNWPSRWSTSSPVALHAEADDPAAVVVTPDSVPGERRTASRTTRTPCSKPWTQGARGIVLIPEGRYRLTKTLYVTTGTRVFGYGKNRPVFVLAPNTPGYQEPGRGWPFGKGKYMVHFANSREADGTVVDASELDFNSVMCNIDFEIGEGNPSAVGVRFKVAQHSYLSYMNFKLGTALAAVEDIGNLSNNLTISGGKYGIITTRTSPNWQYVLMDSVFENQSVAGINTKDVGFSLYPLPFSPHAGGDRNPGR